MLMQIAGLFRITFLGDLFLPVMSFQEPRGQNQRFLSLNRLSLKNEIGPSVQSVAYWS